MLREAQAALNVAFGAILSAYVGISLAEIDNHPFDHHVLARFFIALAVFILGLSVGNSLILRGEFRLSAIFLILALIAAVLRILAGCWVVALLGSNVVLTAINYLHHRNRT